LTLVIFHRNFAKEKFFRMILKKIWDFYYDGFRNLSADSRKLWLIILVKLFIMFAILKVFFFPNILKQMPSDQERIRYVEQNILPGNNKK